MIACIQRQKTRCLNQIVRAESLPTPILRLSGSFDLRQIVPPICSRFLTDVHLNPASNIYPRLYHGSGRRFWRRDCLGACNAAVSFRDESHALGRRRQRHRFGARVVADSAAFTCAFSTSEGAAISG